MSPSDFTGELSRQRIADLRAQADRQRLARSIPASPPRRAACFALAVLGLDQLTKLAATLVAETAPRVRF
jgi:hypothetical protein